jgi:hypothetical protein
VAVVGCSSALAAAATIARHNKTTYKKNKKLRKKTIKLIANKIQTMY